MNRVCLCQFTAILLLAAAQALAAETTDAPLAIVHGPYLQGPRADSMTVVWFTNKPCVSWVEYGPTASLGEKVFPAHDGLIDAGRARHVVELSGLRPGATYRYRVVSKEIVKFAPYKVDFGEQVAGETLSFRTCDPAKASFSFYVIADAHEKAQQLDGLLQSVDRSAVDLVVLDGDMINHFERDSQIFGGFLDVCVARFAKEIPFVYVRGNHETRGALARRLAEFAPVPEGRFYYSFDHGPVHFIVLDSGEDKPDTSKEYSGLVAFDPYRRQQADWLARDVQSETSRRAAFRVALVHMPTHGGNDWHGERHIRQLWTPLLNQGKVDLVISGHTHRSNYLPPAADANQYDLAILSPATVLQVDVTEEQLSVEWHETGEHVPKKFGISHKDP